MLDSILMFIWQCDFNLLRWFYISILLILVVHHVANLEHSKGTRALEITSRGVVKILNSSLTDYTKLLL